VPHTPTIVAAVLLGACTDTKPTEAVDDPAPDTAADPSYTDWVWASDDTGAYAPNGTDAAVSLQSFVNGLRRVHASSVYDSYREAMDAAGTDCPVETINVDDAYGSVSYWWGACETQDGVIFKGPMTDWVFEDIDLQAHVGTVFGRSVHAPGDGWTGYGMQGQANIMDTKEIDYNCSCTSVTATSTSGDTDSYLNLINGEAHWTGPAATNTWLTWGWNVEVAVIYGYNRATGETSAKGSGGVDGLLGRYSSASLNFDVKGTITDDEVACTIDAVHLNGTLRDELTSNWYYLVFTADAGSCLACTTKSDFGEICVDLSPLVSWTDTPW
jgi:hypothetical protein